MEKLYPEQVAPLLYELCVGLGFCLPSADNRRLMQPDGSHPVRKTFFA